jgi:hypothetical protein
VESRHSGFGNASTTGRFAAPVVANGKLICLVV